MSKFKVGDKVKVRSWESMAKEFGLNGYGNINVPGGRCCFAKGMREWCGKTLTITEVYESGYHVKETVWWWTDEMFESRSRVVIIYSEDNKVIALDKATGNKGEAICSSQDEFDFYFGADLAFKRLINGEAPKERKPAIKYYSGEIFCTESRGELFTKGKVYRVKNGILYDDVSPWRGTSFNSFEELNNTIRQADFIEIKK